MTQTKLSVLDIADSPQGAAAISLVDFQRVKSVQF